jgi:hypothetical protein
VQLSYNIAFSFIITLFIKTFLSTYHKLMNTEETMFPFFPYLSFPLYFFLILNSTCQKLKTQMSKLNTITRGTKSEAKNTKQTITRKTVSRNAWTETKTRGTESTTHKTKTKTRWTRIKTKTRSVHKTKISKI